MTCHWLKQSALTQCLLEPGVVNGVMSPIPHLWMKFNLSNISLRNITTPVHLLQAYF